MAVYRLKRQGSHSVQEAGSPRTRGTNSAAPVQAEGLEAPGESVVEGLKKLESGVHG